MILKPQDILLILKLIAINGRAWSYNSLAIELAMSPAEVHAAVKRLLAARLAVREVQSIRPNFRNLKEFLFHGLQYVFVPERGEINRGMPTAHGAEPLASLFIHQNEPPPVWPDSDGEVRGETFSPLYRSVPSAAKNDARLYELLALVDGIRGGKAREKELAKKELLKRIDQYGESK